MKKITIAGLILTLTLIMAPISINAHEGSHGEELNTKEDIIHHIEEQNLKGDTHKELETLIEKIQKGNMTTKEANRMGDLLKENPGVSNLMIDRMMNGHHANESLDNNAHMMQNQGMVQQGWMNVFIWVGFASYIVWFVVGILLIIFLWRKLNKNKE